VHRLPNLPARSPATSRRFVAFVAQQNGQFLVRQRPAGIVNALLWEFPNIEVPPNRFDAKTAAHSIFGSSLETFEMLCTIRHAITRYKITMNVFRLPHKTKIDFSGVEGRWLKEHQLHLLPFASAHKKVLRWLKR
jgi:A/G-specific adenine glycosylase